MSWQAYIDDHLLADLGEGRRLTAAAIIGLDGTVWAQSSNFPTVKPEEVTRIVNGFIDSGDLAQSGLYLGETKYLVIQGEIGAVIRGKKGPSGVTIKRTHCALVIGLYDEPIIPGECNVVVEGLGDYLMNAGL
ncbi:hypothetical protein O6H91_16G011600 [Diphasiastrum complanatum]|uniref:Uncharacterized protein n=1 Tax=Diphasiastrum complanatum TaxID=34168 RepID=A0ACC2B9Y2_DIPCM|nr:hypothetical protein O6H91_Y274500 [Diphasiastrum complanatum]KAJ7526550.1 hypothetical protein O6H91_16G011600 [Diphasiastrum complanatum]